MADSPDMSEMSDRPTELSKFEGKSGENSRECFSKDVVIDTSSNSSIIRSDSMDPDIKDELKPWYESVEMTVIGEEEQDEGDCEEENIQTDLEEFSFKKIRQENEGTTENDVNNGQNEEERNMADGYGLCVSV